MGGTLRRWGVEVGVLLFALVSVVAVLDRVGAPGADDPLWWSGLDLVTGLAGCAALLGRRRWPVGIAVVLVLASAYSEAVTCAAVVGVFAVAAHRTPRAAAGVFVLSLPASVCFIVLHPDGDTPPVPAFMLGFAVKGAAVGWGLFVRHRAQLQAARREQAVQAAAEAELRAEQVRLRAREEIAREMHDVLGHRLSLLSVHAGALEFNAGAGPEEVAAAAKVVRESAHQALQDLREILGVLRAPVGELPQPTLDGVRELVAESVRAGMRVELDGDALGPVPDGIGRTAYRIVQEGLTNVRKHAPGADVRVALGGAPGRELTVEVRNTAAPATTAQPGSGQGLPGLAERVAVVAGRLEHGPDGAGGWRLAAWLPWPV